MKNTIILPVFWTTAKNDLPLQSKNRSESEFGSHTVASPDFMSVWEMDNIMVYYKNDRAYPGLIVMAKLFNYIKHQSSKV